jgi:hypothetical protein
VKLAMDAYMRDLFHGLPDEVLSLASLFIFNINLEDVDADPTWE